MFRAENIERDAARFLGRACPVHASRGRDGRLPLHLAAKMGMVPRIVTHAPMDRGRAEDPSSIRNPVDARKE